MSWFFKPINDPGSNNSLDNKINQILVEIQTLRQLLEPLLEPQYSNITTEGSQTFELDDLIVTEKTSFIDINKTIKHGNQELYIEKKLPLSVLSLRSTESLVTNNFNEN